MYASVNLTEEHEGQDQHKAERLGREDVRNGRRNQQPYALPDNNLRLRQKRDANEAKHGQRQIRWEVANPFSHQLLSQHKAATRFTPGLSAPFSLTVSGDPSLYHA